MLEIQDLELSFAGIKALDSLSFSVERGQIAAIIGPNGAGKTSLFNCISGLYVPQRGQILLNKDNILPYPANKRAELGVARMFQNIALYEHLTVLENMMIGRHHLYKQPWWHDVLRGKSYKAEEIKHRQKSEEIIDFLHLESYRDTHCGVLPYGVLKRVELGRALCMEPNLLLLDEPAAGLNQEETEDMARYILDIKEELGITQILIEHHLHLVLDLADQIIVLDFGKKIASGRPTEIESNPAVLAAYVGMEVDS